MGDIIKVVEKLFKHNRFDYNLADSDSDLPDGNDDSSTSGDESDSEAEEEDHIRSTKHSKRKKHNSWYSSNSDFFFFFLNQNFITQGSLAVRGRHIQTICKLRLRYTLTVMYYQNLNTISGRQTWASPRVSVDDVALLSGVCS
jgi:hypothetical protein